MEVDRRRFEDICNRHAGSLPRYTSYPTAVELKETTSCEQEIATIRNALSDSRGVSLYVHLPYCPTLCYFCACNKVIGPTPEEKSSYVGVLDREAKLLSALNGGAKIKLGQIHLGGGSPSYLSPEEFNRLEKIFGEYFLPSAGAEKSIELDPRNTSDQFLELLGSYGYNRASIGVQDFDPNVQALINRIQPYGLTADLVSKLRKLGIGSINFDLIYGLPGQTAEGFRETISKVIELRPERIALYGYAHVKWKVKVQNVFQKYPLPAPEERVHLFASAVEMFDSAGYKYIGMDHFALPSDELYKAYESGRLRRNFMGYTTVSGLGVLGLGASSISDLDGLLYQNHVAVDQYRASVDEGKFPIAKSLYRSPDDKIRSFIIERIMCSGSVSVSDVRENVAEAFDEDLESVFAVAREKIAPYEGEGFVEWSRDGRLSVTEFGRFFMRHVAAGFDAYLPGKTASRPQFSQSI